MLSTRTTLTLALLFVCGLAATDALGQTVTFDPPKEIAIQPGRLSVVLARGVTRADAEALVAASGLRVEEIRFYDVEIIANAEAPFTEEEVASLRSHPAVTAVDQFAIDISPSYHIRVTFRSETDPDEAEWAVTEWAAAKRTAGRADNTRIVSLRSPPNEVIVAVPPGQEAEAVEVLKANEKVVDVFYVAADGAW